MQREIKTIKVTRKPSTATYTEGTLSYGNFLCDTMEDPVREKKVYARTAIPKGVYRCLVSYSPRFRKDLIAVLDVPNFEGIRIHSGNTHEDTEGCLLVGVKLNPGFITRSRETYAKLHKLVENDLNAGHEVYLDIS